MKSVRKGKMLDGCWKSVPTKTFKLGRILTNSLFKPFIRILLVAGVGNRSCLRLLFLCHYCHACGPLGFNQVCLGSMPHIINRKHSARSRFQVSEHPPAHTHQGHTLRLRYKALALRFANQRIIAKGLAVLVDIFQNDTSGNLPVGLDER